jgi:uncharacterized membrane protein YoaK (UPF0700 family)
MPELKERTGTAAVLLAMTAVTGMVDAVSILALGHVFTANMTGNTVFLGFSFARARGFSVPNSLSALIGFLAGAAFGGRLSIFGSAARSFGIEALVLLCAAAATLGSSWLGQAAMPLYGVIAVTALAMGIQNATARKLGVPDLTTTVLTLTITGLAADSTIAGGSNPRWQRRCLAILAMAAGAAIGALMVSRSVALPLCACACITAGCAFAMRAISRRKERP